mmetsp:Transcript_7105/g.19097  ORF Transcript_7105/g.19097 Transcript_7105/m.19097 type:complete len:89 (-) Transcript_7105:92-358(-)
MLITLREGKGREGLSHLIVHATCMRECMPAYVPARACVLSVYVHRVYHEALANPSLLAWTAFVAFFCIMYPKVHSQLGDVWNNVDVRY